jgi:hypothetical protein
MSHHVKKAAAKALLTSAVALVGLGLASGTAHAFDPQPDPPANPRVTSANPQYSGPVSQHKSFGDGSVRLGDGSVTIATGGR